MSSAEGIIQYARQAQVGIRKISVHLAYGRGTIFVRRRCKVCYLRLPCLQCFI